jgi:hypothetical protein
MRDRDGRPRPVASSVEALPGGEDPSAMADGSTH